MNRKLVITVATFLAWLLPVAAFGGDKHGHDHDHRPLYGGIVAEAADLNYELVARSDALTIYVVEHGKPVTTSGARAAATVHSGKEKISVTFEPAGDNKLLAKGDFKLGVGVRVAVTVALAGKPEAKLNFRLK